jgi:phage shock protein A
MSFLPTILLLAAVVLAALAVWKRAELMRAFGAGSAGAGNRNRHGADDDPLAVLRKTVDNGVAAIQRAKEALEECRGEVRNAQRLLESSQREKARLESRIADALAQGDPQQQAKSYATELVKVEQQIAAYQQELAEHDATYRNFANQVEVARQRVLQARRKAADLGAELAESQHEKELAQFAAGLTPDALQSSADVARAEESIQQQIDRNRAAGRVAADLADAGPSAPAEDAVTRDAAAAQVLQRFQKPSGQP